MAEHDRRPEPDLDETPSTKDRLEGARYIGGWLIPTLVVILVLTVVVILF